MQDPHATHELVPNQQKFIRYLQWSATRPLYSNFRGGVNGSGTSNEQSTKENDEEGEKSEEKEND